MLSNYNTILLLLATIFSNALSAQTLFYKCSSDTITINDSQFADEGVYQVVLKDVNGNDSLGTVEIINYVEYNVTFLVELCPGEEYMDITVEKDTMISMAYSSVNGCDSIVNFVVDVLTFYIDTTKQEYTLCAGDSVSLSVGEFSEYLWDNNATTPSITVYDSGNYNVVVTNSQGCSETIEVEVGQPVIDFDLSIEHVKCNGGKSGSINIETRPTSSNITLSVINATDSVFSGPIEFKGLEQGIYALVLYDEYGCSLDTNILVEEPETDLEISMITSSNQILEGQEVSIYFESNHSILDFQWNRTDLDSTSSILRIRPSTDTTIFIRGKDVYGCSFQDSIEIKVEESIRLLIPTIFSPNSDGVNDYFFMASDALFNQIDEILIADRWGNVILSQQNITELDEFKWDGTHKGEKISKGVYAIYVKYQHNNQQYIYRNSLTII